MRDEQGKPVVIHQHGMADLKTRMGGTLEENLKIADECEDAAIEIGYKFPIASRLLLQEAQLWRGL